jgi:hypothetical protein
LLSKNIKIKIYRTIILPVALYGCETCSLTVRKESRLRFFENKVLRRIFGPKRDEVTGEWRRIHNKKLYAVGLLLTRYHLGDQIKKTEIGRACSTCGEEYRCIQGFGEETWGKEMGKCY